MVQGFSKSWMSKQKGKRMKAADESAVKALWFDFGGVFTLSPFKAVQQFGQSLGKPGLDVGQIVFGSYDEDGEHPWHRLERGEISLEMTREEILGVGREHGVEVDIYHLFAAIAENAGGAASNEPLVRKVQQLRDDGYRLGIITNNIREFSSGWRSLLSVPVDELFEFVVDSCEVGVRKPDPRIFHLAAGLMPELALSEMLFLDDFQANLNSAASLGMKTILVGEDPQQTVRDLESTLARS